MWAAALAWLIAAASALASLRRLLRVRALARSAQGRLEQVRARRPARGDDPAFAQLLGAVRAAPSTPARVAIVNEELAEVARAIDVGARVPEVAGRVAMTAGVALALVELAATVGGGRGLSGALSAAAGGLLAYVVCGEIGRRARRSGQEVRDRWNELGRLLRSGPGLANSEKMPLS